ncbi:Coiled-coil domain-containing protein 84 [Quaeritorhiza haematococci]|nr:Coiled-coil domain-containing protein 84 [Quaeritorhiza haematococci]
MRQTHDKQAHNGANYNETPGKPSSSASTASSVVEKHGLCDVCRRNYSDGKRHFYSRSHAKNVDTLLQKQVTKIAKLSVFRKDIKLLKDPTQQPEIWCIFCEKDLKAKYNFKEDFHVACIHIFEHLSTTQHKKNMHTFFWKHRVSQDLKHHFFIEEEDMEKVRGRSEWEGLAGLSLFRKSAAKALEKAKRKEETERLTRTSQDEPQPAPVPSQSSSLKEREIEPPPEKVHKTIISPAGIYQNPTGWHGTTRVWGGGIVKYQKPGIWIPWPIDVDDESQDFATSHMGNWAINKKQRHGDRSEIIKGKEVVVTENSNTEVDGGNAFDIPLGQPQRKRTIQAYAQGMNLHFMKVLRGRSVTRTA